MDTIVILILISVAVKYSGLLKLFKLKKKNLKIKPKNNYQLFDQYFIEPRNFYTKVFKTVPCVAYIGNVDTKKIFELINNGKYGKLKDVYQRIYHAWNEDKIFFDKTIFILENKMMIKLCDEWLEIYFDTKNYTKANNMLNEFKTYKAQPKEKIMR